VSKPSRSRVAVDSFAIADYGEITIDPNPDLFNFIGREANFAGRKGSYNSRFVQHCSRSVRRDELVRVEPVQLQRVGFEGSVNEIRQELPYLALAGNWRILCGANRRKPNRKRGEDQ